jgi:hypothetical protein
MMQRLTVLAQVLVLKVQVQVQVLEVDGLVQLYKYEYKIFD